MVKKNLCWTGSVFLAKLIYHTSTAEQEEEETKTTPGKVFKGNSLFVSVTVLFE